jgi:TolB-like protein
MVLYLKEGNNMKLRYFRLFLAVFAAAPLVWTSCTSVPATATLPLDQVIQDAARNIETRLEPGVKIALLNFSSPSELFSEYILEELSGYLVNEGKLVVVDRKELDLIRQEERFQVSGEVSDESAQAIGQKIGAQFIVSGSLSSMGDVYRLRIKTLNVETAVIATSSASDISTEDSKVTALLDGAQVKVSAENSSTRRAGNPSNTVYKIGDTGPAGGLIFFDKGVFESGWRYLEAAPHDIGPAQWGASGHSVGGTKTDIGSGKQNTARILEYLKTAQETGRAAQLCAALDAGGYKDWFLPDKDELNLMYRNLKAKGLGGFSNVYYWSSSEDYSSYAWYQSFDGGRQNYNYRYSTLSVRAVRAF